MSKIGWGKPTVRIGIVGVSDVTAANWLKLSEIAQGTSQLNTEQGEETVAKEEGGDIFDKRTDSNAYTFELELFAQKGVKKPIEDQDGIVTENYAVRLVPEDPTALCWRMDRCSVNCVDTWNSADGGRWKYTFSGLKPLVGKTLKPYYQPALSVAALTFTSSVDTTGKTVTVTERDDAGLPTATGTVTAVSDQTWATVTVATNVVTVKVAANAGTARVANVVISVGDAMTDLIVTQAGV
jgi:hypothetical protein